MDSKQLHLSDRFMAPFAKQGLDNKVVGIDLEGLVQRLMLFEHCIIPTIWLKDIQILLRMVDSDALCELIDSDVVSFYIDSATVAEMGQARSKLNLTGNTSLLRDNEFSFSTIKGRDDTLKTTQAINELSETPGVMKAQATAVAERVEAAMLKPRGLEILKEAFRDFYVDLRSPTSTVVHSLIGKRLQLLGAKSSRLVVNVEEFVEEDFRINSNLTTTFGLSPQKARDISLRALLDLSSVHIRLAHMRHFSTLIGMNEAEQGPWEMKVDALTQSFISENQRERQFTRVAKIAGIGERELLQGKRLDLRRLIKIRQSEDLIIFRSWLKQTDNKSDAEIKERISSVRGKFGNAVQSSGGKTIRLMLSYLPNLIADKFTSQAIGLSLGVADSFLIDRILPKDAVLGILDKGYPTIFRK
jgi:hypothetical protein